MSPSPASFLQIFRLNRAVPKTFATRNRKPSKKIYFHKNIQDIVDRFLFRIFGLRKSYSFFLSPHPLLFFHPCLVPLPIRMSVEIENGMFMSLFLSSFLFFPKNRSFVYSEYQATMLYIHWIYL